MLSVLRFCMPILGTADFLGVNQYTTHLVSPLTSISRQQKASLAEVMGVVEKTDPSCTVTISELFGSLGVLMGVTEESDPSWKRYVCFLLYRHSVISVTC